MEMVMNKLVPSCSGMGMVAELVVVKVIDFFKTLLHTAVEQLLCV